MIRTITSSLLQKLPCQHGFFTNNGGVSQHIYKGLNCGLGSQDAIKNVWRNRQMARQYFNASQLITAYQYHSAHIMHADDVMLNNHAMADGIITDRPSQMIGVLTADCGPLLCYDTQNQIIGAAHAGWRGAFNMVIPRLIDAMVAIGANRSSIIGALGPTINQQSYEVSPDFRAYFLKHSAKYNTFFTPKGEDKFYFDLPNFIFFTAKQAGIQMDTSYPANTYNNPNLYSCRYNSHQGISDYGRLLSAIMLPSR